MSIDLRLSQPRRTLRPPRLAAIVAALAAVAATACGGPFEVMQDRPLAEDISPPKGIVLLPVAMMTHRADALEVAVRSSEAARWLLDHTDVPLVGPMDFRVFKPVDEVKIASTDTDLATRNEGDRIALAGWWAMSILVTENRSTSVSNIVDTRKGQDGKTVSQRYGIESTLRVEVQIRDAMHGTVKAMVVLKGVDDPNDRPPEGDPRPMIRALMIEGMRRAIGEALPGLGQPNRRVIRGREGIVSVPALADSGYPNRPSFAEPLKEKKPIERETAILTIWYRVSPNLPLRPALTATNHPGVVMAQDRAPLKKHDVVMAVGGTPVRDTYQLDRMLRRCASSSCKVQIRRKRSTLEVDLRWNVQPLPDDQE